MSTIDTTRAQLLSAAEAALAKLDTDALAAVAWMSAHLAAVERTLLPAAAHSLADERGRSTGVRRSAARLHSELRTLEQVAAGDALTARLDATSLRRQVADRVREHIALEAELVDALARTSSGDTMTALEAAYAKALAGAPTRPHPHAPHRGPLGRLAFRVDAWRDHAMDVMDGRHAPVPRRMRTVREPGRWARYLLGS